MQLMLTHMRLRSRTLHERNGNSSTSTMRKFNHILVFLAMTVALGASAAHAQNVFTTGMIRGSVVDDLGNPASGAVVTARNAGTGFQRGPGCPRNRSS